MKPLIFITIVFTVLIAIGCNPTTYLSFTKNNKEQIEQKLYNYSPGKKVGAEVTFSLKNLTEINGELLSVRDSTITIGTKHSATELELINLVYPIITIRNSEIKELTIKGNNCVWIGLAIGAATFTGIGIWIGHEYEKGLDAEGGMVGFGIIGFVAGAIVGSIVGYFLSADDVILHEIPAGYDWYLIKPLARYPDEEPEYLRAIK
jgi:hypothetical protein